jgi:hypothetical protein
VYSKAAAFKALKIKVSLLNGNKATPGSAISENIQRS